jgi:hypothetical protein
VAEDSAITWSSARMPAGLKVAPHDRQAPMTHATPPRRSVFRLGTTITSTVPPQRSQTRVGSTSASFTYPGQHRHTELADSQKATRVSLVGTRQDMRVITVVRTQLWNAPGNSVLRDAGCRRDSPVDQLMFKTGQLRPRCCGYRTPADAQRPALGG